MLSPPKKRVFQHLREELGETAYKSYWTTELGKAPDQVPNLPVGMNPETTVFGRPTSKSYNIHIDKYTYFFNHFYFIILRLKTIMGLIHTTFQPIESSISYRISRKSSRLRIGLFNNLKYC